MAIVKCNFCNLKDTDKKEMECDTIEYDSGSVVRKYYHKGECWNQFLAEKEFLKKENEERDYLNEVIKDIHGLDIVPSQFFSGYLQGLRNGNFKMGKKVKKSKEGFSYKLIADTYVFCKDNIKYWRENKKFDGTVAELRYCLSIVVDKISLVKKKQERAILKKQIEEEKASAKFTDDDAVEFEQREVKFKKQKDVNDISEFLD
jgi:hypothetical protein